MNSAERLAETKKALQSELKGLDITFGNDGRFVMERISTGMPMLDNILGGGVVRRGTCLIHGVKASGKSYTCYKCIASVQAEGGVAVLIDVEYSYDPIWCAKIGINVDDLIVLQPSSAEEALDMALAACVAEVDMLVVDSLAALLPEAESDSGMGDWQMGLQARLINKFLRKIPPENKNTAVILVNQHRVDINGRAFHGNVPYTLPGGKGQEYFSKIVIETKRSQYIYPKGSPQSKKGVMPSGFNIGAKTTYNKTYIPQLECEIPVFYTGDTDFVAELFELAILYGIIIRGGAYYTYRDVRLMGKENFLDYLREDESVQELLKEDVNLAIEAIKFSEGNSLNE